MRVAYVCADPGVPVFGTKGASVHVQSVLRDLLRRGVHVTLYCARAGGDRPPGLEGLAVQRIPRERTDTVAARENALMAADSTLADLLAHGGPVDAVYERYSLWATAGMRHAERVGVPGILEVNAPLVDEQATHRALHHDEEARDRSRTSIDAASTVVCVSDAVARWVRAEVPSARPLVVSNGVDPHRFPVTDEPNGPFTVGFVGSLKPWHGVDALVRAVALAPALTLRIIGDGPERAALEGLALDLGVAGRTHFTGAVRPSALPAQLRHLHVGVAPYPRADDYFSPLKVFEYLAAGLPVVASRSGQLPSLLSDGRESLLVPPGDPQALAAALERLRLDPALRHALRRQARVTAGRHTWSSVVAATWAHAGLALPPLVAGPGRADGQSDAQPHAQTDRRAG